MFAVMERASLLHDWIAARYREAGLPPTGFGELLGVSHLTFTVGLVLAVWFIVWALRWTHRLGISHS